MGFQVRRVVISGLGIISSIGNNQNEVYDALLNLNKDNSYNSDISPP